MLLGHAPRFVRFFCPKSYWPTNVTRILSYGTSPMTSAHTPQAAHEGSNNLRSVWLMLGSVICFSFWAITIDASGGNISPFYFNAFWSIGVVAGCIVFLIKNYHPILFNSSAIRSARKMAISWAMLWAIGNSTAVTLFTLSTKFIDVSIAAVLLETWPIIFILSMSTSFHQRRRYRKNLHSILPLAAIALLGFAFVTISETGGLRVGGDSSTDLILGISLVVLAAVFSGIGASSVFNWGVELADKLPSEAKKGRTNTSLVFFGTVLGFGVSYVVAAAINLILAVSPLNQLVGIPINETMGLGITINLGDTLALRIPIIIVGIFCGLVFDAGGSILLRASNLTTDNLGINALGYGIPIFSLVWLAIFSEIGVARIDYLVIGTAAIVSANLLINFEAERLIGFKALVISLWACGTWVYLRNAEIYDWSGKSDAYFDVLFLSATVFALILSFRVVRLANRTQAEDNRAFKLCRELDELAWRGIIHPRVSRQVIVMDEKDGQELEAAYIEARNAVSGALLTADGQDRRKLREVEVDLDLLAHSRQQGINFGEICALFIFTSLVVGTALLSRPADVQGLTGFLVEMFAMLFPAVIVFLTFNVLDLQRDRVARILVSAPQYHGYGVAFQDTVRQGGTIKHSGRRKTEQWISVAVGLVLIAAYSGLFLHKWGLLAQVQFTILVPLFGI